MVVNIPGAAIEATGDISSSIQKFWIDAAENALNLVDAMESQFAIRDENAPTTLNAAREYNTRLKRRMLDGFEHLVPHKAMEERVDRATFFDSKILQKTQGDIKSFAVTMRGLGLSETAILKALSNMSADLNPLGSDVARIWVSEDEFVELNSEESKAINSVNFAKGFLPGVDESGSRTAELLNFVIFESAMIDKAKYQQARDELYQRFKDNPNIPDSVKDDAKFDTYTQIAFNSFLEGMRDMMLADVAEEKRNRHEAKLLAKNISDFVSNNDKNVFERSFTFNLQSVHMNTMRDKTLMLGARPCTKENEQQYFDSWKIAINRKLLSYQAKYKVLQDLDEDSRSNNYEQELKETKKLLNRYKEWSIEPDKALKYWESELNVQNLKQALQDEFEYSRKAREYDHMNKPKGLGNMWWSYLVNSQAPNDGRGESDIHSFLVVCDKQSVEAIMGMVAYTMHQFKNNGEYFFVKQKGKYDDLNNKVRAKNIFVDNLQDYLAQDDTRELFKKKYGYVFDYDGKDPKTASVRDMFMVLRKACIEMIEGKNASRYYQNGDGDSFKSAMDQVEFVLGGLELGWIEMMKDFDIEKNAFGKVATYVTDTEGNLIAPSETTKIIDVAEDGTLIPKYLGKSITNEDQEYMASQRDAMYEKADQLDEQIKEIKEGLESKGGQDYIAESIRFLEKEIYRKRQQIISLKQDRGAIGRATIDEEPKNTQALNELKEVIRNKQIERKKIIGDNLFFTLKPEQKENIKFIDSGVATLLEEQEKLLKEVAQRKERIETIEKEIKGISTQINLHNIDIKKLGKYSDTNIESLTDRANKLRQYADKLEVKEGQQVIEHINLKTGEEIPCVRRLDIRNKDTAHSVMGEIAASFYEGGDPGKMFYDLRHIINLRYEKNQQKPSTPQTDILNNEGTARYGDNPEGFLEKYSSTNWKQSFNYTTIRDMIRLKEMNEVGPLIGEQVVKLLQNLNDRMGKDFGDFLGGLISDSVQKGIEFSLEGIVGAVATAFTKGKAREKEKYYLNQYAEIKQEIKDLTEKLYENRTEFHVLVDANVESGDERFSELKEGYNNILEQLTELKDTKVPKLEVDIESSGYSVEKLKHAADMISKGKKQPEDIIPKPSLFDRFTVSAEKVAGTLMNPAYGAINFVAGKARKMMGKDPQGWRMEYWNKRSAAVGVATWMMIFNAFGVRSGLFNMVTSIGGSKNQKISQVEANDTTQTSPSSLEETKQYPVNADSLAIEDFKETWGDHQSSTVTGEDAGFKGYTANKGDKMLINGSLHEFDEDTNIKIEGEFSFDYVMSDDRSKVQKIYRINVTDPTKLFFNGEEQNLAPKTKIEQNGVKKTNSQEKDLEIGN